MNDYDLSSIRRHIKYTYAFYQLQLFLSVCLIIIYGLPLFNPFFLWSQAFGVFIITITKLLKPNTLTKSRLVFWSIILLTLSSLGTSSYLEYGVITISSAKQLERFSWNPSGTFKLTRDIDVKSIDPYAENCLIRHFEGTLDGNNHQIQHLKTPLFCTIITGEIKNLYLVDVDIDVQTNGEMGGLSNYNNGVIENVHVSGSIKHDGSIGGLVGRSSKIIRRSSFSGTIYAPESGNVGGITGLNSGLIDQSHTEGSITAYMHVGGIAGHSFQGVIQNTYSHMDITGQMYVGGIVGSSSDTELSGLIVHGDITGAISVSVITPTYHDYDYDVLFTGRIYSDTYVVEENVLYYQNQSFTVPLTNQIQDSQMDTDFWTQTLGLDLTFYRIDNLYPKLIHNQG
ncbi:MAG: ZmpA/ZmpB/ZmpC family metallo-endopeptidase-related protein [Acholeplasma sp.]|jgi:hypothetical protein|nr:ZmpA/ZmpB/ZmpC family metallo-endopeptidase-related protein [Acholeplasma sp.]